MKSQPVPRASTAISASRSWTPFATSFTEPSPPTTTSSFAPPWTAARARMARCPGCSEMSASPSIPRVVARRAISGQRRPVEPFADAGLTRKTVSLMSGGGRERDARHPVDGCLHLVVRDALELTLDDDVAHDQQAAGLHALERAHREQRRG